VVIVKILSLGAPERYSVRRLVTAAYGDILMQTPDLELETIEVSDPAEIGKYAFTIILPTLVINDKVVCSGRFPTKAEVIGWLGEEIHKT
jgi:Thioredoxin domain